MVFSVIVPVYNVEKYLRECVDSILVQTFTDYELILVDDGSTDSSGAICEEYAKKDKRIKVIHKENGGQASARNRGVEIAAGRYAIFLDSDDFFCEKTFFADIYARVKEDLEVLIFRYYKYYEDGRKNDCKISLENISTENKGDLLESLVKKDAFFCSCWSKCIALSLLKNEKISFDETLRCEDMDWYYSVIQKAKKFEIIDRAYVCYRQRKNSVTSSVSPKTIKDYITVLKKWNNIFSLLEDGKEKEALFSSLAKLYCNLLIAFSRNRKELEEFESEIFAFKSLLKYSLNSRTKVIGFFVKIFGLKFTCFLLQVLDKVRS